MPTARLPTALPRNLLPWPGGPNPIPVRRPGMPDPIEDELRPLAARRLEVPRPAPLWLFACLSLIWKPEVAPVENVPAPAYPNGERMSALCSNSSSSAGRCPSGVS